MSDEVKKIGTYASVLASLAAGLAGVGFVISVVYDIGYFSELGYPIAELPTTFSDHVRSSINWMSYILRGALVLIGFELLTRRIEKGYSEEEIVQTSPNPSFTKKFRDGPYYVFFWTSVLVVISYVALGDAMKMFIPYAAGGVWIVFAFKCQSIQRIQERRPRFVRLSLVYIPALAIFVYYQGARMAYIDIHADKSDSVVHLINNDKLQVNIIRSIDRGFLVYQVGTDVVSFIQLDTVSHVNRNFNSENNLGYLGDFLRSRGTKEDIDTPSAPPE